MTTESQTYDLIPRLPPPLCGHDCPLTLSEPVFPTENWVALSMDLVGCPEHGLRQCPQVVLWQVPQRPGQSAATQQGPGQQPDTCLLKELFKALGL